MADVFLSYKKEERQVAREIVAALEAANYSVWWDEDLTPRQSWDAEIEREISTAKAVLVLWSPKSVDERSFVRKEAGYALDHGKLAPAWITRCDLPLRFRDVQTADLSRWDRKDQQHPEWRRALSWIAHLVGHSPDFASPHPHQGPAAPPIQDPVPIAPVGRRRLLLAGLSGGAAMAVGAAYSIWPRAAPPAPRESAPAPQTLVTQAAPPAPPLAPPPRLAGDVWTAAAKPRELVRLSGLDQPGKLVFSPDGALLAGVSERTATVWDVKTGQVVQTWPVVAYRRAIAFSADSALVYCTDTGDFLEQRRVFAVYNIASGAVVHRQTIPGLYISDINRNEDGSRILISASGMGASDQINCAVVLNAADYSRLAVFKGHWDGVHGAVMSADNAKLYTVSDDKSIGLWDVVSGVRLNTVQRAEMMCAIALRPGGSQFAVQEYAGTAYVLDLETLKQVRRIGPPAENSWGDNGRGLSYSPDGKLILVGRGNFPAQLYDAETGAFVLQIGTSGDYPCCTISADGLRIATSDSDGIRVWEA